MQSQIDLELNDLNQFYASENYYKIYGALCTDGVKYIMDNGYSWFVTDAIIKIKMTKLRTQAFLTVKLCLKPDAFTAACTRYSDGNGKQLSRQDYYFTDAKRELTLYFVDNVLMLASEY
jgi:hypothetical protein